MERSAMKHFSDNNVLLIWSAHMQACDLIDFTTETKLIPYGTGISATIRFIPRGISATTVSSCACSMCRIRVHCFLQCACVCVCVSGQQPVRNIPYLRTSISSYAHLGNLRTNQTYSGISQCIYKTKNIYIYIHIK